MNACELIKQNVYDCISSKIYTDTDDLIVHIHHGHSYVRKEQQTCSIRSLRKDN